MMKIGPRDSIFARPQDVRNEARKELFWKLEKEARAANIDNNTWKSGPDAAKPVIDSEGVLRLLPDSFPSDVKFALRGIHSISQRNLPKDMRTDPPNEEQQAAEVIRQAKEIAWVMNGENPAITQIALQHLGSTVVTGAEEYMQANPIEATAQVIEQQHSLSVGE